MSLSAPNHLSADRANGNLIATYAELVDDGDFAAVGRLLANAIFTGARHRLSLDSHALPRPAIATYRPVR